MSLLQITLFQNKIPLSYNLFAKSVFLVRYISLENGIKVFVGFFVTTFGVLIFKLKVKANICRVFRNKNY